MQPTIDEMIVVDVDLSLKPECESPYHNDSKWSTDHGGDVHHIIVCSCPLVSGLRCEQYVSVMSQVLNSGARSVIVCDCGGRHRYGEDYYFIEV